MGGNSELGVTIQAMVHFKPNDGIKPDRFEIRVRLGCGGVVGVGVGITGAALSGVESWWGALVCGAVLAMLFAWLAARHGDRFWRNVADYLPW